MKEYTFYELMLQPSTLEVYTFRLRPQTVRPQKVSHFMQITNMGYVLSCSVNIEQALFKTRLQSIITKLVSQRDGVRKNDYFGIISQTVTQKQEHELWSGAQVHIKVKFHGCMRYCQLKN